jgi:L-iditol 2-dehydrogenase
MKMKAAIYYGPGDIKVEEIERPEAGDEGMVMRVEACGVCNFIDIPRYKRKQGDHATGIALGHEFAGEVVQIGSRVTAAKLGDRITGLSYRPCHRCKSCLAGDYAHCSNFAQGTAGSWINGGFAEYLWFPFVSEDNIIKLPDSMSYRDAAFIEPVTVGVGLAGKAKDGDVVVYLGQELMGLATVAHLKARGAKVIVGDISAKRLQKAQEVGADIVVNESHEDIYKVVMDITSGVGADVVIETAGRPETFLESIDLVRQHGTIWIAAVYDGPFMFDPSLQRLDRPRSNLTQKNGISIRNPWLTLEDRTTRRKQAIELISSGKITAAKYADHIYPLDKTKEAFEAAMDPNEAIKVIVEP